MKLMDLLSRLLYGMNAAELRRIFGGKGDEPPDIKKERRAACAVHPPRDDTFAWG